ncbi:MAG: GNAT family N-acetyltransferase [Anaerolineae bacterium]|nr:GNAT family N-acetyltransferase [Anaerolineae bacterium]
MFPQVTLRPADPDQDYEWIAALVTPYEQQRWTAERLREADRTDSVGVRRRRLVAVDSAGVAVGYALIYCSEWMQPGQQWLWLIVDPARRGQKFGAAIYQEGLRLLREEQTAACFTEVRDEDMVSLRFAERRGFCIDRHLFESVLDIRRFDESRFAGLIDSVRAKGIRLFSLAEVGDTTENRRKLWAVNRETALQTPGSTGNFPDFEAFNTMFNKVSWFDPAGQILAADGDQFVGISAVGYFAEDCSAYNLMTGVLQSHRGRKIAQALKLLGIRHALTTPAKMLRTHNDSENEPMLRINAKLGYVPQPGLYRLLKTAFA